MSLSLDLQKIIDHAESIGMSHQEFFSWAKKSMNEDDSNELIKLYKEQNEVRKVDFVDGITDKDIIPDRTPPEDDVEEMSGDMAYRAMDKAEKKSRGEMSVTDPEKAKKKARQAQKFADYSIKKTLNKEEVELEENDKAMMMKLTTKAMKAMPNSPKQKELIKQVNVYREKLGMKPMREDYSELDESPLLQMKMAADDIETYAKKHGGIDKKDMMKTASMLKKGNKKGALKFIKTLDTDPRDYLLKTIGEEVIRTEEDKKAVINKVSSLRQKVDESLPPHLAKHFDKDGKPIKGEWKDGKWTPKKKQPDHKITDVTPKGYGPTDEAKDDPCWDGYKQVGMKKKKGKSVPNCVPEETNLERLKKTWAVHKFKKGGGKIEKQPEGDAYNAMKWRGKTHSTRDEDQEDERARNVMAYRKTLRARKKAKKKQ